MNGGGDRTRTLRARLALEQFLSPGQVHLFDAPWPWTAETSPGSREAAEAAYAAAVTSLMPDAILVGSVFEGDGENVLGLGPQIAIPTVAVLYDVIPALQPETYLLGPGAESYWRRFEQLRRVDLLLAISRHSAEQARPLLGANAPEIVPIWGGPYPAGLFPPEPARAVQGDGVAVPERYIFTVGGDHPRKNLDRLVQAWGQVSAADRKETSLVISCRLSDGSLKRLEKTAKREGLNSGDVVFTGEVSDARLDELYRGCQAFVFPSTDEGLGMPPLEAMMAGKATILAHGSSLSELVDTDEAYFDGRDVAEMGRAISRLLTDAPFVERLQDAARRTSARFTWSRAASLAWDAIPNLVEGKDALASQPLPVVQQAEGVVTGVDIDALSRLPDAPGPVRVGATEDLSSFIAEAAPSLFGVPADLLARLEDRGLNSPLAPGVRTALAAATAVLATSMETAELTVAAGVVGAPLLVDDEAGTCAEDWLTRAHEHDFYRHLRGALSELPLTLDDRSRIVRAVSATPRWMLERPWPVWLLVTDQAVSSEELGQARAHARRAGGALAVGTHEAVTFAGSVDVVLVEGSLQGETVEALRYARSRGTVVIRLAGQQAEFPAAGEDWYVAMTPPTGPGTRDWYGIFTSLQAGWGRTAGWPWRGA